MLPSSWELDQLAKQRLSEARARAARARLLRANTPLDTCAEDRAVALRVVDRGDVSTSRSPGALRGLLRPLSAWWHRA
jgi:hypothetical protein